MPDSSAPQTTVRNGVSGITVTVVADPADLYLQSRLAAADNFEPAVSVARHCLPTDATVLDLGASLGFVTAALATLVPDGRVIAVEAGPHIVETLRATAALAGPGSVTVVHAAIGDHDGDLDFHLDASGAAWGYVTARGTSLASAATARVVTVPQTTIDRIVADTGLNRVDMIKIDIEGYELRALAGATTTLAAHRPIVMVELNPFCLWRYGRTLPQDLTSWMRDHFAHLVAIAHDGVVTDLADDAAISALLATTGTTGGVADLVGSHHPLDLPDRFHEAVTLPAASTVGGASSRWIERMRRRVR